MKKEELKNLIKECVKEVISEGDYDKRLGQIDDAYNKRHKEIAGTLTQLVKGLKKHKASFQKERKTGGTNWGYVGDLGHYQELLDEIVNTFSK